MIDQQKLFIEKFKLSKKFFNKQSGSMLNKKYTPLFGGEKYIVRLAVLLILLTLLKSKRRKTDFSN